MECPTCKQEIAEQTASLDVSVPWWAIEDLEVGQTYWVDEITDFIEMVQKPAPGEFDSYGEGVAEDIFMILKVGDKLYKKDGYRSSYGGTEWDGDIREVKGVPRTITVFDYV